jgi:hypothetical protein
MKFKDTILSKLSHRYYILANKVLRGLEANYKLDIFLTLTNATLLKGEYD